MTKLTAAEKKNENYFQIVDNNEMILFSCGETSSIAPTTSCIRPAVLIYEKVKSQQYNI